MQDHVFFDCKHVKNDISEMAAIRTDGEGNIVACFNDKIKSNEITFETACNGLHSVILKDRSEKIIVVCHYIEFIRPLFIKHCEAFLIGTHKQVGIDEPFKGRSWIDTAQLAWPLVYAGIIKDRSLDNIANYFSLGFNEISTAAGTVQVMSQVYWRMMDRFILAQKVEGGVRRVGGSVLEKVLRGMNSKG